MISVKEPVDHQSCIASDDGALILVIYTKASLFLYANQQMLEYDDV